MGNKLKKCAPKGYFTCRTCKEFSPYTQNRKTVLCPECQKILKLCDCGCSEMIPKYLNSGGIRKYKNKTHWNNHQWADPEHKKAMAKLSKERWEDPEYVEFFRQMKKKHWQNPKYRQLMIESGKAQWQNPGYRTYMSKCHAEWRLTPEGKEHARQFGAQIGPELRSQNATKQWQDPEIRASMIAGVKRKYKDPEYHRRHSQSCKTGWTEEARLRVSGPGNHCWTGGAEIGYGENWGIQSQKARERDVICQYCGKTNQDNGSALCVHHIIPFKFIELSNYKLANDLDNLICYCISCHVQCPVHFMPHEDIADLVRNGKPIPGPNGVPIPNQRTENICFRILKLLH